MSNSKYFPINRIWKNTQFKNRPVKVRDSSVTKESQILICSNCPRNTRNQNLFETFNTWINFSDTGVNLSGERVVSSKPLLRSNCSTIIFWQRFIVSSFHSHLHTTWVCISSVIVAFFLTLWGRLFDIEPTSITSIDCLCWVGDSKANEFEVDISIPWTSEECEVSTSISTTTPGRWSFSLALHKIVLQVIRTIWSTLACSFCFPCT